MELRIAELERRLARTAAIPGRRARRRAIGAKEARKARQRQESERERSKDRKRGGQPGHKGKGAQRDPDPGERKTAAPPAGCRSCKASLDGAAPARGGAAVGAGHRREDPRGR